MQYPTEVPGVMLDDVLTEALSSRGRSTDGLDALLRAEAGRIGFDERFLDRALNVDLSGGEKKRNETLQLAVLAPRIAILDELDSGLDIDALRDCARRVEAMSNEPNGDAEPLGVLAITHYNRLLHELKPDHVHILAQGRIVASGGAELAVQLETDGYAAFAGEQADCVGRRSEKPRRPVRVLTLRRWRPPSSRRSPPFDFPGWTVVAGCFIVLTTSSGLGFYGLAVYLNAFSNEQGWPLKTISLATTLFFIVGGVVGVAVARVIARFDVRYVIVGGGVDRRCLRSPRSDRWRSSGSCSWCTPCSVSPSPPPDWCRRPRWSPAGSTSGDRWRCRWRRRGCRSAASSSRRSPSG